MNEKLKGLNINIKEDFKDLTKSNMTVSDAEETVKLLLLLKYLKTEDEDYLLLFKEVFKDVNFVSSDKSPTPNIGLTIWSLLLLLQLTVLILLGLLL